LNFIVLLFVYWRYWRIDNMDSELTEAREKKLADAKAAAQEAREKSDDKISSELKRLREMKKSGLFERSTASEKTDFSAGGTTLTLVEFNDENVSLEGATMVVGFPGLTLTPAICTGYLREQLNLHLLGVVHSTAFPPRCLIENGQPGKVEV
jgi:hypothetical protein